MKLSYLLFWRGLLPSLCFVFLLSGCSKNYTSPNSGTTKMPVTTCVNHHLSLRDSICNMGGLKSWQGYYSNVCTLCLSPDTSYSYTDTATVVIVNDSQVNYAGSLFYYIGTQGDYLVFLNGVDSVQDVSYGFYPYPPPYVGALYYRYNGVHNVSDTVWYRYSGNGIHGTTTNNAWAL